ncbi:MAG: NADH-quinone oxidoreductase subunit J [Gammaproteobacteria bacterium]|nr:NADH-quinone oxidoreductase subunit J [Gammaproteobacteria bacterium]NIN61480.1 NADH-quinone oxidoreductase subunit J [Gammaproteobacteria bacterium]NIO61247.1 NADH-quinone oxidoreductase subunit J [Gammaproteobacteria bacterium]NIP48819.1 NADH-quinone oxidoreductase subunit J [Gammaproteobacteria bacterium]NIQ09273.1 NADH-quinone oxidoreductase subunit J [Gammaproteobacteria bacterium]
MVELLVFYFFGAVLVISASMVVTIRNPVFAALFLVLCFFSSAAIWLILQAEFLAIALVLVYVGAVMVLFLFVVMMLDINIARLREGFVKFLPVGIIVALLMLVAMSLVITSGYFNREEPAIQVSQVAGYSNTTQLGKALFTEYLYPFEIAGVILLVAIIAAISLTMRKPRSNKTQQPSLQVRASKKERLRIIKMKAEPKQDAGGQSS